MLLNFNNLFGMSISRTYQHLKNTNCIRIVSDIKEDNNLLAVFTYYCSKDNILNMDLRNFRLLPVQYMYEVRLFFGRVANLLAGYAVSDFDAFDTF